MMHLLLHRFRLLRPRAQLVHVLVTGTYLANRWHFTKLRLLYHLADGSRGFFAEVGFDEAQDGFAVLRSFSSSGPLEEYTQQVRLPGD